jgi:hypothetical protein
LSEWRKVLGDGDLQQVYKIAIHDLELLAEAPVSPNTCRRRLLEVYRSSPYMRVLAEGPVVQGVVAFCNCGLFDYSDIAAASMSYLMISDKLTPMRRVKAIYDVLEDAEEKLRRRGISALIADSSRVNRQVFRKMLKNLGYVPSRNNPESYLIRWL